MPLADDGRDVELPPNRTVPKAIKDSESFVVNAAKNRPRIKFERISSGSMTWSHKICLALIVCVMAGYWYAVTANANTIEPTNTNQKH